MTHTLPVEHREPALEDELPTLHQLQDKLGGLLRRQWHEAQQDHAGRDGKAGSVDQSTEVTVESEEDTVLGNRAFEDGTIRPTAGVLRNRDNVMACRATRADGRKGNILIGKEPH